MCTKDDGSYSSLNSIFTDSYNDHSFDMEKYNSLKEVLPIIVEDDLIDNKHAVNPDMFSDYVNNNNYEFRDRGGKGEWYANTNFTIKGWLFKKNSNSNVANIFTIDQTFVPVSGFEYE